MAFRSLVFSIGHGMPEYVPDNGRGCGKFTTKRGLIFLFHDGVFSRKSTTLVMEACMRNWYRNRSFEEDEIPEGYRIEGTKLIPLAKPYHLTGEIRERSLSGMEAKSGGGI